MRHITDNEAKIIAYEIAIASLKHCIQNGAIEFIGDEISDLDKEAIKEECAILALALQTAKDQI